MKKVKSQTKSKATLSNKIQDYLFWKKTLISIIPKWFKAEREFEGLLTEGNKNDTAMESIEQKLGKTCNDSDLKVLEKHLGKKLPEDYRAYLMLYGKGEKDFGVPLGPDEHKKKTLQKDLNFWGGLFDDPKNPNPLELGAIPFIFDADSKKAVMFVPQKNGLMKLVDYDIATPMGEYADVGAYFHRETSILLDLIKERRKELNSKRLNTQRKAIDWVVNSSDKTLLPKEVAPLLRGRLRSGGVPGSAIINAFHDPEEAREFVAKIRANSPLHKEVGLGLAYDAGVTLGSSGDETCAKALEILELIFDFIPKQVPKNNSDEYKFFLNTMLAAIRGLCSVGQFKFAERLCDIARPHMVQMSNFVYHRAACVYAGVNRLEDALEMCRMAVETKYDYLNRLKKDENLGPLLKNLKFKALFK